MDDRRRSLLQISGAAFLSGLSGCLQIGGGQTSNSGENPDPDPQQSSTNQTNENEADEEQDEEPEEEEENQVGETALAEGIDRMMEFMMWMSGSGYNNAYNDYWRSIRTTLDRMDAVSSKKFKNISHDDVDTIVSELKNTRSIAFNRLGEYFRYHYTWDEFISEVDTELKENIERNEKELFFEELRNFDLELTDVYQRTEDRYPAVFVDKSPYKFFFNRDTGGDFLNTTLDLPEHYIFEVRRVTDPSRGFFTYAKEDTRIEQHPFGVKPDDDGFSNNTLNVEERSTDTITHGEWLQVNSATERYYINILDYSLVDGDYPADYNYENGRRSQTDVVDLNKADGVPVSIQVFDTEQEANTAFDTITSKGQSDGTNTYNGITYKKYYYIGTNETYYADLKQVGRFVIALDVKSVPWDRRSITVADGGDVDKDSIPVEDALSDTVFDPVTDPDSE